MTYLQLIHYCNRVCNRVNKYSHSITKSIAWNYCQLAFKKWLKYENVESLSVGKAIKIGRKFDEVYGHYKNKIFQGEK